MQNTSYLVAALLTIILSALLFVAVYKRFHTFVNKAIILPISLLITSFVNMIVFFNIYLKILVPIEVICGILIVAGLLLYMRSQQ